MDKQEFIRDCMSKLKEDFPNNNQNKILIFPRGRFFVEKYQEWFNFDDLFFEKIIDTFYNSNLPRPFLDIDHEQGKSYGEIKELLVEDDGLYGIIELTEEGKKLLKDNAYRYISPSWGEIVDNRGKKWEFYLNSVSFTNIPALLQGQQKLQEQLKLTNFIFFKEAKKMKKINYELSQITDDAVKKLVEDLITQGEAKEEIINSLQKQLDLLKEELVKAQQEAEKAKQEVAAIKEEALNREAEDFVEKQLNQKKIQISVADYWKKQYKLNKDDVIKYFEAINSVENEKEVVKLSNKYNLTNEDIIVMKSLQLDLNNAGDIEFYIKHKGV